MIDKNQPFFACLVGPRGRLLLPLRWAGPNSLCNWHFFKLQMLDYDGQPLPQPYPTPPEYWFGTEVGWWVFDIWDPPQGYELVELTEDQWQETRQSGWCKVWDPQTRQVTLRPEHVYDGPGRGARHANPRLELAFIAYGGEPVYRPKSA